MSRPPLRLGTRKSPMAMAQSGQVARLITERTGVSVELVGVTTFGDVTRADLAQIGGTGVFASALRETLLAGQVDLAVHSLKDLPVAPAPGLVLAAVPAREDPRDALAARDGAKFADLPAGATVGTGSPRRAAQLRLLRPDIRPVPVRGNAGTRLGKVESGELDAVLLASAGLARIGRLDAVTQIFEPEEMLPAPGQGALAVECRAGDTDLAALLAQVDDRLSRAAVTAERAVLAGLAAGCSAPVGAYAAGTEILQLRAIVAALDGGSALRGQRDRPRGRGWTPRPRRRRRVAAPGRGGVRGRVCRNTSATGTMHRECDFHVEGRTRPASPTRTVPRRRSGRPSPAWRLSWAPGLAIRSCSRCAPPGCWAGPTWCSPPLRWLTGCGICSPAGAQVRDRSELDADPRPLVKAVRPASWWWRPTTVIRSCSGRPPGAPPPVPRPGSGSRSCRACPPPPRCPPTRASR